MKISWRDIKTNEEVLKWQTYRTGLCVDVGSGVTTYMKVIRICCPITIKFAVRVRIKKNNIIYIVLSHYGRV